MTKPATKSGRARRLPRIVRIVRARPRLFLCGALALVIIMLLPGDWRWSTRFLVGWDIGAAVYLVFSFAAMADCDTAHIRRRSAQMDEGRIAILVFAASAALATLAAIIIELGDKGATHNPWHLALAGVTLALSWASTHTIFALHYAHEFYAENRYVDGGLAFPGKDKPDYWDFMYFSLVIGMTSQVSDVAVTAKAIRRTVMAHGVVSFFFNATLVALVVNIAASALSG
ncbi:MAG: hypothetical protein QOG74_733 [Alphaproteobacteria bacterium]|nr:hypothetical protein [Alphaproteobacteria bacterium]